MMKKTLTKFGRYKRLIRVSFAIFISYLITQSALFLTSTVVLADSGDEEFQIQVPNQAKANFIKGISDQLDKQVPQLQGLGAVVLVLACITCGIRIGASAITENAQQRQDSIRCVFWLIFAGTLIIHARKIIGGAL